MVEAPPLVPGRVHCEVYPAGSRLIPFEVENRAFLLLVCFELRNFNSLSLCPFSSANITISPGQIFMTDCTAILGTGIGFRALSVPSRYFAPVPRLASRFRPRDF